MGGNNILYKPRYTPTLNSPISVERIEVKEWQVKLNPFAELNTIFLFPQTNDEKTEYTLWELAWSLAPALLVPPSSFFQTDTRSTRYVLRHVNICWPPCSMWSMSKFLTSHNDARQVLTVNMQQRIFCTKCNNDTDNWVRHRNLSYHLATTDHTARLSFKWTDYFNCRLWTV